tara:strand:+ start:313 stop:633 length:321 start_codon:yes stop_codon:yes gene_type:complete
MNINKKIYDRVKYALTNYPKTRENDHTLMAVLWHEDIKKGKTNPKTAIEFIQTLSSGSLTNWESVTRCRRKIMEEHVELRGLTYTMRQSKAKVIKKQIKTWPSNVK